jgi:heme exporter protein A
LIKNDVYSNGVSVALSLTVEKLSKSFGPRKVIRELNFGVNSPGSLGITGRNGSGKTTLMKILCQLVPPSKGKVVIRVGENEVEPADYINHLKMISPEMALYEMLTGYENLRFFATLASVRLSRADQDGLLERVGLAGRGDDLVAAYSSGMKQRLKYAVALLAKPAILLLDEPTANLDEAGKAIVTEIMMQQKSDGILIIATNEPEDLKQVANVIRLDN